MAHRGPRIKCVAVLALSSNLVAQELNRRYDHWDLQRPDLYVDVEWFKDDGYILSYTADTFGTVNFLEYRAGIRALDGEGDTYYERGFGRPETFLFLAPSWTKSLCRTRDGGYALLAKGRPPSADQWQCVLYRLTLGGDSLWTYVGDLPGSHYVTDVIETADYDLAVAGFLDWSTPDGTITRIDSTGADMGTVYVGDPDHGERIRSIVETVDGDYIVCGSKALPGVIDRKAWVARVSAVEGTLWSRTYEIGDFDGEFMDVTRLANGGYALCGNILETQSDGTYAHKHYLVRIDEIGDTLWTHLGADAASYWNFLQDAMEHPNGNIYAVGFHEHPDIPGHIKKGCVSCISPGGQQLWHYLYQFENDSISWQTGSLNTILLDRDLSSLICAGECSPLAEPVNWQGGRDAWLIRIQEDGCLVPGCSLVTGLAQQNVNSNLQIAVAPNPARDVVIVSITLPSGHEEYHELMLTLVSSAGQLVKEQRLKQSEAKGLQLDLSDVPQGAYFLHLSADSLWLAGKEVIVY